MEIRRFIFASLFLVILVPVDVQAMAIGMPLPTARLGVAVGLANVAVDDPVSETANEWLIRPINLIYTNELLSARRYWLEAFYQDAVLPASQSRIGQHVKQLGLRASLQQRLGTGTIGESWLGAGLQLSSDRFVNRHTVDSAGYLAQRYPDRSGGQAAILLSYVLERNMFNHDVAFKVEKSVPLSDGVSEFTLAVTLLFDY